jgi:hypothetical protein
LAITAAARASGGEHAWRGRGFVAGVDLSRSRTARGGSDPTGQRRAAASDRVAGVDLVEFAHRAYARIVVAVGWAAGSAVTP